MIKSLWQQFGEQNMYQGRSFWILFCLFSTLQAVGQVKPLSSELTTFVNVRDFTAFQQEAYFTAQDINEQRSVLVKSTLKNGQWGNFEKLPFSGRYRDIEPFISPDGLRLYFASNRPVTGTEQSSHYDIWYLQRTDHRAAWSQPIHLSGPVNTEHNEFYPAVTANNNLYFTSDRDKETRKDDIYVSRWFEGHYQPIEALSDHINSSGYEFNAYVATDESFIIYTVYGADDGLGSGDLYISYRGEDGQLGPRQNLGLGINSDKMDYCPFYDASNNRLVWTSKRSAVGDTGFNDIMAFKALTAQYENGQSRLYQAPFKPQDVSTRSAMKTE
ncbi:MAG: hypothetical protein OQK49_00250 [Proteobacteria bacterium]|nr:hypothetical protein [Pseudomonadota bacterium]